MWLFYRVAFSNFVGMVATLAQMGIWSFLLLRGDSNLGIINEKTWALVAPPLRQRGLL